MAIADAAWFLFLSEFIQNPLAASIEFLAIFSQKGQIVLDDPRMLKLRVEDERKNAVDALAHTWQQFPSGLQPLLHFYVVSLHLFDFFIVKLVADDGVSSHFGHQEHHLFHFAVQLLLHFHEIVIDLLLQLTCGFFHGLAA